MPSTAEDRRAAEQRAALAAQITGFGIWQVNLVTGERIWDDQMFRLRGFDPRTAPDIETVRQLTDHHGSSAMLRQSVNDIAEQVRRGELEEGHDFGTKEFQIRRADDGEVRWLCARATLVLHGVEHPIFTGLHWDITEHKRAAELERRRDVAEETAQAKTLLLANVSHEIRTPMTAILGMSALALRTSLDAQQRDYVGKIERSAKTLLRLVDDLLDYSKIDADRLALEHVEFDLDALLDEVAGGVALQAEARGLELVFDIGADVPAGLRGDPLRLGQVLTNLTSNALKFTEQGAVVLSIQRCDDAPQTTGDGVRLRIGVSDSGRGLTTEQIDKLFQAFEQADTSIARQYGGTGLGLAISQRLVQAMGGRIDVTSEPGRGARFVFEVRFGVSRGTWAPGDADRQRLRQRRALVVNGRPVTRAALVELLRGMGASAHGVTDEAGARREVEAAARAGSPFELLVIDSSLPNGAPLGAELLRAAGGIGVLVVTSPLFERERVAAMLRATGVRHGSVLALPAAPAAVWRAVLAALDAPADLPAPIVSPAPRRAARPALQGARVLLVEDNEINQDLIIELLRPEGVIVTLAHDGREAIEQLNAATFDVVLMDCQMPVMDGYEATEHIRRDGRWADLPILALTASATRREKERALACGMNAVLAKPIDIDALLDTLAAWRVEPRAPR